MQIAIPNNLLVSIKTSKHSQEYLDLLYTFIGNIEDRIAHNNICMLFADYTDHGINHIQTVLDLTEFLIADGSQNRPDSWKYFTAEDSIALILAVLMHDIGMHLSESEVIALINNSSHKVKGSNDIAWLNAWENFISEANRWDSRKLKDIYGADYSNRIKNRRTIQIPSSNPKNWDEFDKRLIGEFLRLNHSRIAHEIAVLGLPLPNGKSLTERDLKIPPLESIPSLADLVGFIARSHCMSLPDTLIYLDNKHYNTRITNNIHAVFLVCLLRVADILNIHAERAPGGVKALSKRKSPYSKKEWETHQAIENVRLDSEPDPEAVAVDVSPEQVKGIQIYYRIKEWLTLLQEELNSSWAILGQVYGRYAHLQDLWLQIRRVHSNIFTESFQNSLPFYPQKASFDSKNPDFLKLLIAPLYGERPEIGLRELLQNAIDAVRELDSILSRNKDTSLPYTQPKLHHGTVEADILLNLCSKTSLSNNKNHVPSDWEYWIEITDRGVGMEADVVKEYFLKAGSTFRSSDYWQKHFTHNGSSLLLRSGKFGVGVLAGFLIGDNIQVITKHYAAENGLKFESALDDEIINIQKTDCSYGTTIRVKCSHEFYEEWSKNIEHGWCPKWYYLKKPVILWCINDKVIDEDKDKTKQFIPDQGGELPPYWRRIDSPYFSDIHWTYQEIEHQTMLFCNGIEVPIKHNLIGWEERRTNFRSHEKNEYNYEWPIPAIPTISVFDPNCNLNLNLARDGLTTDTLPFSKELKESVLLDVIAHSIICGPTSCVSHKTISKYQKKGHPGYFLDSRQFGITQWLYTKSGFTLADPYLLLQLKPKKIIFIFSRPNFRWGPSIKLGHEDVLFALKSDLTMDDRYPDWNWPLDKTSLRPTQLYRWESPLKDILIIGARVLVTKKYASEMLATRGGSLDFKRLDYITHDKNNKLFIIDSKNDLPPISKSLLPSLMSNKYVRTHLLDMGLVAEVYINEKQPKLEASELAKMWLDELNTIAVPYSFEDREVLIGNPKEKLKKYFSCWERDNRYKEALRQQAQNPDKGAYPIFKKADEIKCYLKQNGINRKLYVRKQEPFLGIFDKTYFTVYLVYDRSELKSLFPDIPDKGDPFEKTHYDESSFPDYTEVKELLAESNTGVVIVGPKKKDPEFEDI